MSVYHRRGRGRSSIIFLNKPYNLVGQRYRYRAAQWTTIDLVVGLSIKHEMCLIETEPQKFDDLGNTERNLFFQRGVRPKPFFGNLNDQLCGEVSEQRHNIKGRQDVGNLPTVFANHAYEVH